MCTFAITPHHDHAAIQDGTDTTTFGMRSVQRPIREQIRETCNIAMHKVQGLTVVPDGQIEMSNRVSPFSLTVNGEQKKKMTI